MKISKDSFRLIGFNLIFLLATSLICRTFGVALVGSIGLIIFILCTYKTEPNLKRKLIFFQIVMIAFLAIQYGGLWERYGEPYYGGDDLNFEKNAEYLIDQNVFWFSDIPYIQGMWYAKGFPLIISWFMRLSEFAGGYHTIIPRIFNIYLWMSIVLLTVKMVPEEYKKNPAFKKATAVFALFPNAIYISSFVYRDTMVLFVLMLAAYSVYQCHKTKEKVFLTIVTAVASAYLLYYMRSQLIFVLAVILGLILFWERVKGIQNKVVYRSVLIAVGVALIVGFGGLELFNKTTASYSELRLEATDGLSGNIFSIPLFPIGIFARFIWGLCSPFPGGILSLEYLKYPVWSFMQLLVYLGTVVQICMIPFLWTGIKKLNTYAMIFLVVFLSIVSTTFTFRHMILSYPFMYLCIVEGLPSERYEIQKKVIIMLLITVLGGLVYSGYLLAR